MPRQAPAATIARPYHAFRPTQIALKGRKHALKDEDDAELEAELAELEREKRELEALEKGETVSQSTEESNFQEQYDTLLNSTAASTHSNALPRHTALYHLTKAISTRQEAEQIPAVVAQWRLKSLPITFLMSDKLIHKTCTAGSPETALELLGDREKYGLAPGLKTMRRVVKAFAHQVSEEGQSEEGLAKLNGAFKTMALIPYYNLAADDASIYASLIRGSLAYGGEEGLRRASVTMDEYLLIDGEREAPLTKKRATELVVAAQKLVDVYEAEGQADKAKALTKSIAQWSKSL
ncbi:hypothetical protein BGZ94_002158 [Podila epigama]|nr:hypothetical protein BGZ94_002158 [Podila epigama]